MSTDNKMTFHDFTERVAKRAHVSNAQADTYIHQLVKSIGHALEKGREVPLYHFGRFHLPHVDERQGRDPGTGETLTIPAHTNVHFRPYSSLRFAVNMPFRHLRMKLLADGGTTRQRNAMAWILLGLAIMAFGMLGFGIERRMSARTAPQVMPATTAAIERPAAQATVAVPPAINTARLSTDVEVTRGDTLWAMAATKLGNNAWWPVIYAENRAHITGQNPDLLSVGDNLRIPSLEGSVDQPTAADLKLKTSAYQIVANDYSRLNNSRAAEYREVAGRGFTK